MYRRKGNLPSTLQQHVVKLPLRPKSALLELSTVVDLNGSIGNLASHTKASPFLLSKIQGSNARTLGLGTSEEAEEMHQKCSLQGHC